MTRKHTEQVRAMVLAAIMVGSVVAMTTAFAGTAVSATDTIVVDDSGGADYETIQAAVDNASDGDTIKVKPGTYREHAKEKRDGKPSDWEYGLFIHDVKNLTIVGVHENGSEITDPGNVKATVRAVPDKNNLPGWGPVSYLVTGSADGLTIQGLKLVDQFRHTGARPNKNLEVWANNVTIKHSIVDAKQYPNYDTVSGSIYFTAQPNDGPITSPVISLTVKNNRIEGWLSMNNGVGLQKDNDTTAVSNRVITGNTIHGRVKITGNSSEAAWRNRKTAAVTVVNNTFTSKYPDLGSRFESEGRTHPLPWREYFFKNTYEVGATTALNGSSSTFLPRMGSGDGEDNERVIYDNIQDSVDWADSGDAVAVRPGTYTEQVDIDKGLTLTSTAGPEKTTITHDGGGAVIRSTADLSGLTIEGFTIKGTGGTHGIYLTNQGSYENVTVRNNVLSGSGTAKSAALLWNLDGTITVAKNEFTADYDGLNIQGNTSSTKHTDLVVEGNSFSGLGDNGAEFNSIDDLTFKDNTIENYSTNEDDTAAGLEIAEDGDVTGKVTVTGNTISNGPLGLAVYPNADDGGRPLDISGNEFTGGPVYVKDISETMFLPKVFTENTFPPGTRINMKNNSIASATTGRQHGGR
ncbi:MAG: right-handed parallel beta-helix repeat-containing protein [Halobacteriales archaeon]